MCEYVLQYVHIDGMADIMLADGKEDLFCTHPSIYLLIYTLVFADSAVATIAMKSWKYEVLEVWHKCVCT